MRKGVLFIGGPEDGKWHVISDGRDSYKVAVRQDFYSLGGHDRPLCIQHMTYHRYLLAGRPVYILDDLTIGDATAKLLRHYRPNGSEVKD